MNTSTTAPAASESGRLLVCVGKATTTRALATGLLGRPPHIQVCDARERVGERLQSEPAIVAVARPDQVAGLVGVARDAAPGLAVDLFMPDDAVVAPQVEGSLHLVSRFALKRRAGIDGQLVIVLGTEWDRAAIRARWPASTVVQVDAHAPEVETLQPSRVRTPLEAACAIHEALALGRHAVVFGVTASEVVALREAMESRGRPRTHLLLPGEAEVDEKTWSGVRTLVRFTP